ncbi:UPF0045 protein M15 [Elasticomyces elasticus]|nr:UPF0045 protein M15 [Elasticomyces elasticus]KAK4929261.1 UPF0045 protein M15 [Elasticomyces elasticus]KAK5765817.1 UPF0045 protein M15 [Elasticomyces elasticus]
MTKHPHSSLHLQHFCIVPIGTPTASVSAEVAEVQRLLKKSGIKYSMHSAGTTIGKRTHSLSPDRDDRTTANSYAITEGSWEDCMKLIGQCHSLLHANGVVRIQSDIRVGSRTDKKQGFEDKVKAVEDLLAKDEQS